MVMVMVWPVNGRFDHLVVEQLVDLVKRAKSDRAQRAHPAKTGERVSFWVQCKVDAEPSL